MAYAVTIILKGSGQVHVHRSDCRRPRMWSDDRDAACVDVEVETRADLPGAPVFMACTGTIPAAPGAAPAPDADPVTLFLHEARQFGTPEDAERYAAAGFHVDDAVLWANAGRGPAEAAAAALKGYAPATLPAGPVVDLPELPMPDDVYGWIIDVDHTHRPERPTSRDAAGTFGPRRIPFRYEHQLRRDPAAGQPFRIFDGEGELCYSGRYLGGDGEELFGPLDDYASPNVGATVIKYQDPDTRRWWEL